MLANRNLLSFVILAIVLLLLSFFYLASGAFSISIWKYITFQCSPEELQIIHTIRLPRFLIALCAGAALSVAGALVQCLFKNPLASTGILGTDSAATLGAIFAIFIGITNQNIISATAFFVALAITFFTYSISFQLKNRRNYLTILLLYGIAIATLCSAVSSVLLSISLEDWEMGKRMVLWGFGSLENLSWFHAKLILPITFLCLLSCIPLIKSLNLLNLDDESAQSLGVPIRRTHLFIIFISTLLASIIISITGMIGFIGLICPHMVRTFTGNNYLKLLPFCALIGAIFLIASDLFIIQLKTKYQVDLNIGILTTLIGAPIFLSLLFRKNIL